jgi:RNA polymerase sigma-70 factor (ECF subfamily)
MAAFLPAYGLFSFLILRARRAYKTILLPAFCKKLPSPPTTIFVGDTEPILVEASAQDDRYREAATTYGAALDRLARAYEADPEKRRDLLQEIHLALWKSFAGFDGRCSLRTWVYRVAHNSAVSHIRQHRGNALVLVSLEELEATPDPGEGPAAMHQRHSLERLLALIQQLKPLDRQVILSYLEGLEAASIAEVTGISPGNVATKIHRIKNILAKRFHQGGRHAE